jgi:hypothetical protein
MLGGVTFGQEEINTRCAIRDDWLEIGWRVLHAASLDYIRHRSGELGRIFTVLSN